MTVFKRKNVYHYDFVFRGERYRGTTYMTNKADATQYESDRRQEAKDGLLGKRKVPTIEVAGEDHSQALVTAPLAKKTKLYYANGLRLLKQSKLRHLRLSEVTDHAVNAALSKVGPSSINCAKRTLSVILGWAMKERVISRRPELTLLKERVREMTIPKELAEKIISIAPQPLKDVYTVLYDTGMRPEEVFRMDWGHVDWKSNTYFNEIGKTDSSRRLIALSERILEALRARLKQRKRRGRAWVFPARNAQSKSGHITSVIRQWYRVRDALIEAGDIPESRKREFVLYLTRHSFGTRLMRATRNTKVVMEAMGHADMKTALRYQHPDTVEIVRAFVNEENQPTPGA
jgi:integrase